MPALLVLKLLGKALAMSMPALLVLKLLGKALAMSVLTRSRHALHFHEGKACCHNPRLRLCQLALRVRCVVSLRNFAVFAVTVKEVADAAASSVGCEPV